MLTPLGMDIPKFCSITDISILTPDIGNVKIRLMLVILTQSNFI